MRDDFVQSLRDIRSINPDLMLLTADLGFGIFEEFEQEFPNSFLNVGVCEQAMIGVASGLALSGRPVFTYSIGNFAFMRCLEQIRNDAAYHDLNVNIVASGGGFSYGQLGMSHHATEDLAIMRALPNVEVYAPCTPQEASVITSLITERPGVAYLRLDKSWATDPSSIFELGALRKFSDGEKVAIIGIGGIVSEAIEAGKELNKNGISTAVFGCHCLKPFDKYSAIAIAKNFDIVVTVEEHSLIGGLYGAFCETITESSSDIRGRVIKVGIDDVYSAVVGDQKYLKSHYKMDHFAIVDRVTDCLKGLN